MNKSERCWSSQFISIETVKSWCWNCFPLFLMSSFAKAHQLHAIWRQSKSHYDVLWAHILLATSESFSVLPETHNFVHPGILFFFYLSSHWLISTVWPPEWSMFEPVKSDRHSIRLFYCIYEKLFYAQRCPSGNLVTSGSQRYAAVVPLSSHRVGVFLLLIKIS